jgi:hypothetical protein
MPCTDTEQQLVRLRSLGARNQLVAQQCNQTYRWKNERVSDPALDALSLTDHVAGMLFHAEGQLGRLTRDCKRLTCPSRRSDPDQLAFEQRMTRINARYINNCLDIADFAVERAESLLAQSKAAQSESRNLKR